MVFSTNSSFSWDVDNDGEDENWTPSGCRLYVSLDRKQRAGKPVSFIEGHDGPASDLLSLGKDLKKMCGVGGTVKEGCILIQGDHRDKIVLHLEKLGYTVKRKGG
jgi:translation initiation factor 1